MSQTLAHGNTKNTKIQRHKEEEKNENDNEHNKNKNAIAIARAYRSLRAATPRSSG